METLIAHIKKHYPSLEITAAREVTGLNQFNRILVVDETWVFRFPRSPAAVAELRREVLLLDRLVWLLSTPIPDIRFRCWDPPVFAGYPLLPGEPLLRPVLESIQSEVLVEHIAAHLAGFLRELHAVPPGELGVDLPIQETLPGLQQLHAQIQEQLFPHMRPEACEEVDLAFQHHLSNPAHFKWRPVLRHGDFGGSNILYDVQRGSITAVIDFGSTCLGDPAMDVASLSTLGETFLARLFPYYPEIQSMLPRARFYRSLFPLEEALYGLRDGDEQAFERGLQAYR